MLRWISRPRIIQRNEIGSVNIRVARNESRSIIYLDKFLIYSISFLYIFPVFDACLFFQKFAKIIGEIWKNCWEN